MKQRKNEKGLDTYSNLLLYCTGVVSLRGKEKEKKETKLEGKEGNVDAKSRQQLPQTIINHQERDNRIAQPTGEQLSFR